MHSPILLRQAALTAAAAASLMAFGSMDADPSLWIWDKMVTNAHLRTNFDQKRIWITGASSGIGEALALQLDQYGAHLILSARNQDELQRVANRCGPNTIVLPLDVTNRQQVDEAVALVGTNLDCLILNAGAGQLQPAMDSTIQNAEQLFQINALAPIYMAHQILNHCWSGTLKHRGGHLVVTSSVASKLAVPLSAAYAASKHAVHGYFRSLRSECPWLRIDLPCPGPTQTNFFKTPAQANEMKMPVDRCARLILVSMTMRQDGERWIAQHPTLFFLFLQQYFPGLATRIVNKLGPIRLKLFDAGLNLYDPSSFSKLKALEKDERKK